MEGFLCVAAGMSDHDLRTMAVIVYAVFRATSFYRNKRIPTASMVFDSVEHWWCKVAVEGHSVSSVIFSRSRTPTLSKVAVGTLGDRHSFGTVFSFAL